MDGLSPIIPDLGTHGLGEGGHADMEKACKGLESAFLNILFKEMDKTIGDSGLLEDESVNQTRGMFWMFLADEMGKNGGLGLWKEIERALSDVPAPTAQKGKVGEA